MSTPRDAECAVLTGDRVLLIGGRTRPSGATTETVDLFDPAAGTVTPCAPMQGSRSFCPPVPLKDGLILLPGGFRQLQHDTTLRACELFSPTRCRWTRVGNMDKPRELHTADLLPDQTVLIAGGFSNGAILNTAEIYVPRRHRFYPVGNLHTARFGHTASLLPEGLLIVGGRTSGDKSLRSTEIYNFKSKTWSFGPTLVQDRFRHMATVLQDGRILIVGGYSSSQSRTLDTAEIYDPQTGLFTLLKSKLSDGCMDHTATLLPDGRVLIAGGWCSDKHCTLASVDLFDPKTDRFSPAAPLPISRHEQAALLLPDGRVLIAGGLQVEPKTQHTLDDLVVYSP